MCQASMIMTMMMMVMTTTTTPWRACILLLSLDILAQAILVFFMEIQ